MNVLVTGGCGFVGRHIVKKMSDMGYDLEVVDNLVSESALHPDTWPKHLKPIRSFSFIEEDARKYFTQRHEKFDIVIHLAAIVGGRLKIENAPLQVAEDLSLDAEMFSWVSKYNPEKLCYYPKSEFPKN